jgi:hypothetical protein
MLPRKSVFACIHRLQGRSIGTAKDDDIDIESIPNALFFRLRWTAADDDVDFAVTFAAKFSLVSWMVAFMLSNEVGELVELPSLVGNKSVGRSSCELLLLLKTTLWKEAE